MRECSCLVSSYSKYHICDMIHRSARMIIFTLIIPTTRRRIPFKFASSGGIRMIGKWGGRVHSFVLVQVAVVVVSETTVAARHRPPPERPRRRRRRSWYIRVHLYVNPLCGPCHRSNLVDEEPMLRSRALPTCHQAAVVLRTLDCPMCAFVEDPPAVVTYIFSVSPASNTGLGTTHSSPSDRGGSGSKGQSRPFFGTPWHCRSSDRPGHSMYLG